MRRSFLRQALVVLAAGAMFLPMAVYHGDTAQAASINFPSNCSMSGPDGNGNFTLTCQTSGGTFTCSSISASPSAPSLTQSVTLTANCSNNVGSISYTWTAAGANAVGCPSIGTGASQEILPVPTGTSPINCTYNLSATDTTPTTALANKTLSYTTGGGGGGGGGGNIDTSACTALGLTARVVTVAWGDNTVVRPPTFGPNDALIVQFTTSSVTTSNSKGNISAVEFNGPWALRAGALSDRPCDFTVGLPIAQSTSFTWFNGQNPSFGFSVANPVRRAATLLPNTTYYLNITNIVPAPPPLGGTQELRPEQLPHADHADQAHRHLGAAA